MNTGDLIGEVDLKEEVKKRNWNRGDVFPLDAWKDDGKKVVGG